MFSSSSSSSSSSSFILFLFFLFYLKKEKEKKKEMGNVIIILASYATYFKIWLVNSRKVFLSHLATVLFSKSWIAKGKLFFRFMKFSPSTPQNRNYIQDCM